MASLLDRLDLPPVLADEEAMLVRTVRQLAEDVIAPRAAHYDRTAEFPSDNVAAINALGLNAMFVPEAYGGAPVSYSGYLACVREISKACAATGSVWSTTFHAMKPLIDFGTEDQKGRLLPKIAAGGLASLCITEPHAGSDATGMRTRFVPEGDQIRIDGGKTFITNGTVADRYLLFGNWSEIEDPRKAISVLVVEGGAGGLEVVRTQDKMGIRASPTATLAFQECRVPRANLLGAPATASRSCSPRSTHRGPRSPLMRSASPAPRSRTLSLTSTNGGSRAAGSSSSRASNSCSPISRASWHCANAGSGTWAR
jgi:alkylation response protein AidB-like acyl-CoA dehydrogenase